MWLAIVAQLLTAATALGLLWKDWSELKKRHRCLPIGIFVCTIAFTGLSFVQAVNAERQEAEHRGEAKELRTTLKTLLDQNQTLLGQNRTLLDQNRALQQQIEDLAQSTKKQTSKPVTKKPPDISTIINAPNGIPIVSNQGTVNNPTVNNYGPLPRHLLDQTKNELIECLKKKPGRFSVGAVANNSEAYKYAEDWRSVFLSAGWQIEHKDIPVQIFMIAGGMWSGIQIRVHDASTTPGQIAITVGSPEQNASECLLSVNGQIPGGGNIIPYKDFPTGSVRIDVSDQIQK
jgi:hypothetical protein